MMTHSNAAEAATERQQPDDGNPNENKGFTNSCGEPFFL